MVEREVQPLGRAEAQIALEALVTLPGLQLAVDEPQWRPLEALHALEALPIPLTDGLILAFPQRPPVVAPTMVSIPAPKHHLPLAAIDAGRVPMVPVGGAGDCRLLRASGQP